MLNAADEIGNTVYRFLLSGGDTITVMIGVQFTIPRR